MAIDDDDCRLCAYSFKQQQGPLYQLLRSYSTADHAYLIRLYSAARMLHIRRTPLPDPFILVDAQ